jgi:Terminase large subunit, T4likevirus-type, N-terminal
MNDAHIPLKADAELDRPQPAKFELTHTKVAPFPRDRFIRFINKLKVQSKDYGLVPFRMLGSQLYILDEIEKGLAEGITTFVILKARQLGASTFFLALDAFWAFEHKGLLGVFLTHKEESRDDFRAAVEVFFAETPKGFLVKYVRHNRNLLILKNGSKFRYLIAGTSENRKGGLGRSGSANYVHSTETAFYGNGDDLAEFRSQTSSLYPHRLQIYETTANGFNWFWDMWEQARKDPTKRAIFVGWWRDERNQLPTDHPFFLKYMPDGIKSALTPLERKRVREVREAYAFDISLQQVAWYRFHLESEKDGDQSMMDQEYPWTEDDAFQATGSKFFTVEALTNCTREAKQHPFHAYRYKLTHNFAETKLQQTRDPRAPLRVWEEASKFGYYVVGCDPAFGSSDEADRSVVSVWRCYADAMVQVAEYCSAEPSTYQCAWVLAHLCGYYGLTYIMPILEITGPGQAVFDELEKVRKQSLEFKADAETEYNIRNILQNMRHYLYKRIDTLGSSLVYQWRMTEELKRRAMHQFKNGVELGRIHPRSVPLLEEMRRIVSDEGHIGAEGRAKDDRVIGAALAYQGFNQWTQPKVRAAGLTWAKALEIDERGGTEPIDRLIVNYLRRQNINVPAG